VRSIIGRFLEHTRIFYFRNNLAHNVYLSSADWMDRNFFRRIEVCFPVLDKKLKKRVIDEGLNVYMQDNFQAWEMDSNGHYRAKPPRRAVPKCAQSLLLQQLADPAPEPL
jgi:polyphosphate kinase